MTPEQIADLHDAEKELQEAEDYLSMLMKVETTDAADLRSAVLCTRLWRAVIDAIRRPVLGKGSIDPLTGMRNDPISSLDPSDSNVIPFPVHHRVH